MDWMTFLYFTTGTIYILLELNYILKNKRINLISAFRVMYSFSYGFFPAIMCYRKYIGLSILDGFNNSFIPSLLIVWIISIFQYIIISLTYKSTRKSRLFYKSYKKISYIKLKLSGLCIIVLAFVSIMLWSKAFGSIWNFVLQADAIRARYSIVHNPFAFLEHVSKVIFFATFIFLALLIHQKNRVNNITNFIFFVLSCSGSFLIILMTDGRALIGMLVIAASFFIVNHRMRNGGNVKKELIRLGLIFIIAFTLIVFMDPLLRFIRFGDLKVADYKNTSIFEIIEKEFGFIIITRKVVLDNWLSMNIDFKIISEIVKSLIAWIPSRFILFETPIGLWDYNTLLISNVIIASGQSPTDFVSASIYLLGIGGIVIIPLILGVFLKKIETTLQRTEHNYYLDIIYAILMQRMLLLPTHFALYNLVLDLFYLFIGHIIVVTISKIKLI